MEGGRSAKLIFGVCLTASLPAVQQGLIINLLKKGGGGRISSYIPMSAEAVT